MPPLSLHRTVVARMMSPDRAILVCSLALAGCWPYRVVSPRCAEVAPGPSLLAATASLGSGHLVHGKVSDLATGEGLEGALVNFGHPEQVVQTQRDGSFVVSADTAGIYAVRVRRVGYREGAGTLRVLGESLSVAQLALGATRIVFDGCGYVQVRERRPWWQSWYPPAT